MAITESDQKVIQDLFMDAARDLLKDEREILTNMLAPINERLREIETSINRLADYEELKGRIERLEQLAGFPRQ